MAQALRMSLAELTNLQARASGRRSTDRPSRDVAYANRRAKAEQRAKQKYGNQKIEIDGMLFDSKAEARYWSHLKVRVMAGEIANLKRQVVFELAPSVVLGGRKRPPLRYIADFVWDEAGKTITADVKGVAPEAYRIKRHLMKAIHGIDILEIRS